MGGEKLILGKIISRVGAKFLVKLNPNLRKKTNLKLLKKFLGKRVFISDDDGNRKTEIGRVSDVIGRIKSPNLVIALDSNLLNFRKNYKVGHLMGRNTYIH